LAILLTKPHRSSGHLTSTVKYGRGSGKSHFFGELMVERCLVNAGTLAVCIREVQKSLLQSSKRLIESKIAGRRRSLPSPSRSHCDAGALDLAVGEIFTAALANCYIY
jgi:hypothetical protein